MQMTQFIAQFVEITHHRFRWTYGAQMSTMLNRRGEGTSVAHGAHHWHYTRRSIHTALTVEDQIHADVFRVLTQFA